MQLFVGVWPSAKVRQALSGYPRPGRPGLRWSTPSQWLVKLRPLGHVPDRIVPGLIETLTAELEGAPRLRATLQTPLPGEWLRCPVRGLEELQELVFEVTEPLVPRTHPHNDAHLVLARGRSPRELVAPLSCSWSVSSVSVAQAVRTPEGPGYGDVAVVQLGGAKKARRNTGRPVDGARRGRKAASR